MKAFDRRGRALLGLTLGVLFARLLSLATYPLMDTTEARYAEIGRKMVELGDWVTPWYDYGVPFWGKPPLSFWLTALSFKTFGINEFAARLPHFLLGALVLWLLWQWAALLGRQVAVYTTVLLTGAVLFLISSGAVMTDMSLVLGTTLAMRGFWLGLYGPPAQRRREGWLLFLGLGIGLLAKGPLVFVITGLPLALWTLWNRRLGEVWRGLPWLSGFALALLMALPWYVLAERHTPGFLDYFIVGEHWHRYMTPGWKGDLYGHAHLAPRGSIWLFALEACLPWTLLLPLMAWFGRRRLQALPAEQQLLRRYLWLNGLMPCLFFTMAPNILATYVLPGLPALALLGGLWLARQELLPNREKWLAGGLVFCLALVIAAPLVIDLSGRGEKKSAKGLVQDYTARRHDHEPLLMFSDNNIYSPAFYSQGKLRKLETVAALLAQLGPGSAYVAMDPARLGELPPAVQQRLQPLGRHGGFELYRLAPLSTAGR